MGHRQKGKHKKRKKSWHRGRGEDKRWIKAYKRMSKVLDGRQ